MSRYAEGTTVSVLESRDELRAVLSRYGASEVVVGLNSAGEDVVKFSVGTRPVRIRMVPAAGEQAYRSQWRAFILLIKAKLAAVDSGITSFDQEFLSHLWTGKQTVGAMLQGRIENLSQLLPARSA